MAADGKGFLLDNLFLVAAVALPVVVVGFFLIATAVPRWLVPPPRYDLVLRVSGIYDQTRRIAVDYTVRDGRVEATVRPIPANGNAQPWMLFIFDHQSMNVREIPVDLPSTLAESDPPRTIAVSALAGRQVVAQAKAPDGYQFETRPYRNSGIVGEIFGMNRYEQNTSLVNGGPVVRISLPAPYEYQAPVSAIGWVVDQGQH
jgi:hypothetical protein